MESSETILNWIFQYTVLSLYKKFIGLDLVIIEPRSDNRDLLAIKVKSEIFTEKERPSCSEQLQKI